MRWLEGPETLGMDDHVALMLETLPGMFEPMEQPLPRDVGTT